MQQSDRAASGRAPPLVRASEHRPTASADACSGRERSAELATFVSAALREKRKGSVAAPQPDARPATRLAHDVRFHTYDQDAANPCAPDAFPLTRQWTPGTECRALQERPSRRARMRGRLAAECRFAREAIPDAVTPLLSLVPRKSSQGRGALRCCFSSGAIADDTVRGASTGTRNGHSAPEAGRRALMQKHQRQNDPVDPAHQRQRNSSTSSLMMSRRTSPNPALKPSCCGTTTARRSVPQACSSRQAALTRRQAGASVPTRNR